MKNFTLSLIVIATMSTAVMAETYPAYGPDSYNALHEGVNANSDIGPYMGLGYSYVRGNIDHAYIGGQPVDTDITGNAVTVLAGYSFNQNIAIEARYSNTFGDLSYDYGIFEDDYDDTLSNIALYLKPRYVIDKLSLYALLGLGKLNYDEEYGTDESETSFQWGLGSSYTFNSNFELFVDYIRLYDDDEGFLLAVDGDIIIDTFTFGVNYSF